MRNPEIYFSFLFLFISSSSCLAWSKDQDLLVSCLTRNGIRNYSTPSSPQYQTLLHLSMKNLRFAEPTMKSAPLVIFPNSPRQMQISFTCARNSSAEIKLRSGGHSYEGFSSMGDSPYVIIDMMNLNEVVVDVEEATAWIQAGATVGEVQHAVASSSNVLAFPAGLCPTVGTGGHLSGGGYGTLARHCGLAADNIVDAIIIEPELGNILSRKNMSQDVFWAIRGGGGGNYAAIIAWKIKLCQVPDLVTAFKITRIGTPTQMSKLWNEWQVSAPKLADDFFIMMLSTSSSDPPGLALSFHGLFLGTKIEAYNTMNSEFPHLKASTDELREMTCIQSVLYLAVSSPATSVNQLKDRLFSVAKTHSKIKSDLVRHPIAEGGILGVLELIGKQPKGVLAMSPYGGAMGRIKSDAIAFPHRAGNLYSIEYVASWTQNEDEEVCTEWLRRVYEYMAPYVSKGPRAATVNGVDRDLGMIDWSNYNNGNLVGAAEAARVWGERYFVGNYDRLVRAKTLIDPSNIPRHPQSVPPLTKGRSYASTNMDSSVTSSKEEL